jgi:hypothetical protein
MERVLKFKEYIPENGIELTWEEGFEIKCTIEDGSILIDANKAGLLSLANHLVNLAQDNIPGGSHLHFDEYNSLEDGSTELIIVKNL